MMTGELAYLYLVLVAFACLSAALLWASWGGARAGQMPSAADEKRVKYLKAKVALAKEGWLHRE
jgi:hypothetical protein